VNTNRLCLIFEFQTCQQYKVACLEALISTAFDPVCVDLTELRNAGSPLEDTFCHSCNALVNRKRSFADDQRALEACPPKTPRNSSADNLLQEINELMKQVKNEKSLSRDNPIMSMSESIDT